MQKKKRKTLLLIWEMFSVEIILHYGLFSFFLFFVFIFTSCMSLSLTMYRFFPKIQFIVLYKNCTIQGITVLRLGKTWRSLTYINKYSDSNSGTIQNSCSFITLLRALSKPNAYNILLLSHYKLSDGIFKAF